MPGAALVDFAPRQRAELVDEAGPVGAALRGGGESRCDADVFALHRSCDADVLVGPHRGDDPGAPHRRDDAERFGKTIRDGHDGYPSTGSRRCAASLSSARCMTCRT